MRIVSYNVNGIRSAIRKGFLEWLAQDKADIVCLQETKAEKEQVPWETIESLGYTTYWFSAQKKGYSGVAVFSKILPKQVIYGTGATQSDAEGRVIRLDFADFSLFNCYFPSGTSGVERQTYKYQWLEEFQQYLEAFRKQQPNIIVCGDYNIAHKAIDIHNPIGNKNSSGFLPEERAWMDQFLASGFTDSFRHLCPDPHHYSWWSQRFPSVRKENKGWRIDYISVSLPLTQNLKTAAILPQVQHSDHCPVSITLDLDLK